MAMMKNMVWYLFITGFIVSGTVSAQERRGRVTDNNSEPLDMATVVLLANGMQAAVAVTDTAGWFDFSVADGEYVLNIRNITYEPLGQTINIKAGVSDLGVFVMEESVVGLNEVVVLASTITREADRFVMRVNSVPSMLNKDATEVIRLAPGAWIDDNGIYINGMRGAKVFVNERELKLPEKEIADYLRNFRSSDIARIEIIPQAGSEYSADSRGGVVNIILRKQQENGLGGNIMFGSSLGRFVNDYKPAGTINSRIGRLTLNASASGVIRTKGESEMTFTRIFNSEENSYFRSQSLMHQKRRYSVGRVGAVYEFDSKNSFGAEFEIISKDTDRPSSAKTVIRENGVSINGASDYFQNENDRNISATVNYVYKIDTLGSVLKFIADYADKKVVGDNDYKSLFGYQGVSSFTTDSIYRNNSSSNYNVFSADISFNKQLKSGMKLLVGAKYIHNDMSDTVSFESFYLSHWEPLRDYSFSVDYTENISSAYGTFIANAGGFSLSAGIRAEYTYINGKGDDIRNSYVDLFPNANITYSLNAMRTFMLIGQYSRNIERPNFWYLNPNRVQYTDYSYMVGNPDLRPAYINKFGLTVVYKYRYIVSVGSSLHRDLIREFSKADVSNPDVIYITPENHCAENHYYAVLSFPLKPTKWFETNFNLVGVRQDIRSTENDGKSSHYLYFNNITTNFTLPEKIFLEISYSGTSRLYSANSGVNPSHIFNANLKKQLFSNCVAASVGINNIFDRKVSYFSNTERFVTNSYGRDVRNSRFIKLSIQYNFKTGKSFKRRDIERTAGGEKSRLEKISRIE